MSDLGCQPIIFAGAGLTLRYGHGMSWSKLLSDICSENELITFDFAYYQQTCNDLLDIGELFVPLFHQWAWGSGKSRFDSSLFTSKAERSEFLKSYVAQHIEKKVISSLDEIKNIDLQKEITLLQQIQPHSIITTNYDKLCELVFKEYTPVIGQKIIKASSVMIGEIFKIHGCVSDYREIVLTKNDYDKWTSRKKYLSAKLLTFFLEHPLIIIGYSAQDPNVLAILRDIDEILLNGDKVAPNIFYVIFNPDIDNNSIPSQEVILNLGEGRTMRVHALHASDYSWIYKAFAANEGMENVNPKVLRALMARTYDLVRYDIPKLKVQCDFQTLEKTVSDNETLPKLLGITGLNNPTMLNATYPYTLTAVAEKLGYKTWHGAEKLIANIQSQKDIDIKASDNQYHIKIRTGKGEKSESNKYSEACIELLEKVKHNEPYEISLMVKQKNPT